MRPISNTQLSMAMEAIIGAASVDGGSKAVAHILERLDLEEGSTMDRRDDDAACFADSLLRNLEMVGREEGEEGGKSV